MAGRRILFVTQQVDPGHPALAATVPMVRALAERVDEVVVLADRVVAGALPENCRALSFGARTRLGRGFRFEWALLRELARRPKPRGVVAHMCPIYAVLAAPLARPLGVRVLLWFTHWKPTRKATLAEKLSSRVVSVDRRSFPLPSRKVTGIGHGIDVAEFACRRDGASRADFRAVFLGRYSPAKGLPTVLHAVRLAADEGLDLRLEVYGPALNAHERAHRAELEQLVAELGLERRVRLGHAVLRTEVPDVLTRADVLINNMEAGAPDKVVYEAAASCLPVLASNPVFDDLLDDSLRFDRDSPRELADRLKTLAALSQEERAALGRRLRERVVERHSVDHWAEGVLQLVS
jgi:glycosyltransferase involved in cell wall biosynthesis